MNSILAAGLGGAIGGALGATLGKFVARALPERSRRAVQTLVTVGLAVFGWNIAVELLSSVSSATPAVVEARLLEDPGMGRLARAWRDTDPASYSRFARRMAAGIRAGHSKQRIVNETRAELMAAAVPRLLHLDDSRMIESARISIDHYDNLRANQPSICRPFFVGEPFGDMAPYVSADALRRELGLLEAAFRADISTPRPVATGEAFDATLSRVLTATHARVGEDVLMLTGEASAVGRDVRFCAAASAFHQSILELPPAEAAAFLRGLRAPA